MPVELIGEFRTIKSTPRDGIQLWYCVAIGKRLVELKAKLPHGEWMPFLKSTAFSQSTAHRFMQLYREYGINPPLELQNISMSKALLMLSIPKSQREQFATEFDIEHASTRKTKWLIDRFATSTETVNSEKHSEKTKSDDAIIRNWLEIQHALL